MSSGGTEPQRVRWVVIDANGWFLPVRSGTDLRAELERLVPGARTAVPDRILDELHRLRERGVSGASVAFELARKAVPIPTGTRGDDSVLEAAHRLQSCVLTADRALIGRALKGGLSVLVPRDRTRLQLRRPPAVPRPRRATVKNRAPLVGRTPVRRRIR